MHKLMNKDKIILRFTAAMAPTETHGLSQADAGRVFVLSYFLMDDSILIVSRLRLGAGGPAAACAGRTSCSAPALGAPPHARVVAAGSDAVPRAAPARRRAQFEPPVRNSGIVGGKFLERQRVYKPGSEEIYTYQVGAAAVAWLTAKV